MSETTTKATERIAAIPVDELLTDFHEASKDLQTAEIAVKAGEVQYRYRIDGNKEQLQVIQGEIKRRIEVSDDLLAALIAARDHLNYCNYGDQWENECARDEKLPEKISAALAKAGG